MSGSSFRPKSALTREVLAFGLVRAFGRDSFLNPDLVLSDVPATSWLYQYANVAVSRGWMAAPGGVFNPAGTVNKVQLNDAIARVLQLLPTTGAVNAISSSDGYAFKHPNALGVNTVAHHLPLITTSPMRRDTRYSETDDQAGRVRLLALSTGGYRLEDVVPRGAVPKRRPAAPSTTRRKVVEFALRYSGTPYHYGGERASTGVDCSGYVWWVLRSGMNNAAKRGYKGWSLPERSSAGIAAATKTRIGLAHLRPLDILLWDVEGDFTRKAKAVGHAGIYLGNGWFIHSSGSRAGVALDWMGDG